MSMTTPATASTRSISPSRRIWLRFRADRTGYWSLVIFSILFIVSLGAELVSNDKPLVASYQGKLMFPMLKDYSDKHFGGDFDSPADYLDPFIEQQFRKDGNWASIRSIATATTR
jgi:microcin C transport system permease protein